MCLSNQLLRTGCILAHLRVLLRAQPNTHCCCLPLQPPEQLLQRAAERQQQKERREEESRSLREYNEVKECTFTPQLQPRSPHATVQVALQLLAGGVGSYVAGHHSCCASTLDFIKVPLMAC